MPRYRVTSAAHAPAEIEAARHIEAAREYASLHSVARNARLVVSSIDGETGPDAHRDFLAGPEGFTPRVMTATAPYTYQGVRR